jgi:hypothetical protein
MEPTPEVDLAGRIFVWRLPRQPAGSPSERERQQDEWQAWADKVASQFKCRAVLIYGDLPRLEKVERMDDKTRDAIDEAVREAYPPPWNKRD